MTSVHAVVYWCRGSVIAAPLCAGMLGAQSVGTRPPGAPPGTPTNAPTVIPNNNPVVATPTPSQLPTAPTRGTAIARTGGTPAVPRLPVSTTVAPSASAPWTVTLIPGNLPFRVGQCSPVSIQLLDASGKEAPRGPDGARVSLAEFDMTVTSGASGIVGEYHGASSWLACVCPGVQLGTVAIITATYPSRSIAAKTRVPGVAFRSYITLAVGAAPAGSGNPPVCASIPPTTTVATNPSEQAPAYVAGATSGSPGPNGQLPPTITVADVAAQAAPAQAAPTVAVAPPSYGSPAGVAVSGTPAEAHVTWIASRDVSGYSVQRWKETDPNCCRGVSPALPPGSSAWTDLVQSTGPWVYRVTATFPDGSQRYSDARYVYPEPQAPAGFHAVQTAPGVVTLSWQPVRDASYYVVGGPPGNTAFRVDGTSTVVNGVPAGNQTWMVAANYASAAGPQQGSAFINTMLAVTGAATITPGVAATGSPSAAAHGQYRVIATGFRVLHETKDDMLSRDGAYDEVYGAFTMFHYDRSNSAMLDHDLRRTQVIGDINNHADRLQGGTASASGGFHGGDVFPIVVDPAKRYLTEPTDRSFPFLIWQGTLTDGVDAVIILPTLWEWDGNSGGYDRWFANEFAHSPDIWTDAAVQHALTSDLGLITPPGQTLADFGQTFSAAAAVELVGFGAPMGILTLSTIGDYDRPIGATDGPSGAVLPRRGIVITRENVETALRKLAAAPAGSSLPSGVLLNLAPNVAAAMPNGGLPFGTIAVPLFDGPGERLQGRYILYITVERLP